ncbi:EAL domain-containing protein [Marinobacter subterrani]|uniref:EAL domain n=1 Tax=Marinobacter subterrani TaxID=1658765 RepID=A0A0J7J582_9GAMM|nr:EAL domain-containing protein [Marinobacter subterrani]KMQ73071.1 EAL domain [Marinobacter subterrani]
MKIGHDPRNDRSRSPEYAPIAYRGKTRVSVSLDDGEVFDKAFPEYFLRKIRSQAIEPTRIALEVCESAVLSEAAWQRVIPELARCGFRVMVKRYIADNAGFDVLASPHIAAIKVAPQVIAELPGSILARRFLRGLQALANAINKQLIVDGVETLGQALWLEALGCKTFQGTFYGLAMDARNVRHFVLEGRQHASPIVFKPVTS